MFSVASAVDVAVTATGNAVYTAAMDGAPTVAITGTITGKLLGEDWVDTTPDNEVWTDATPSATVPFVEQVPASATGVWLIQ